MCTFVFDAFLCHMDCSVISWLPWLPSFRPFLRHHYSIRISNGRQIRLGSLGPDQLVLSSAHNRGYCRGCFRAHCILSHWYTSGACSLREWRVDESPSRIKGGKQQNGLTHKSESGNSWLDSSVVFRSTVSEVLDRQNLRTTQRSASALEGHESHPVCVHSRPRLVFLHIRIHQGVSGRQEQ